MKDLKTIFIVATVAIPMTVQAQQICGDGIDPVRVFYLTTEEPETDRDGTLDPPTWQGRDFTPIPEGMRGGGYIQRFTPISENAQPGTPAANNGEWTFARYAWSHTSMIVNTGDCVAVEFYGVLGTRHNSQFFHGVLSRLGERPGPAGLVPVSDVVIEDPSPHVDESSGVFSVNRGELTTVYFNAGAPGTILLHCHSHGPTMNAYFTVLP